MDTDTTSSPHVSDLINTTLSTQVELLLNSTNETDNAVASFQPRIWTTVLGLCILTTLFGNGLVVAAVYKHKSLQQSVTNYLIVSLAVADITVGALVMPLAVYVEVSMISYL